jgi:hypothetical protein
MFTLITSTYLLAHVTAKPLPIVMLGQVKQQNMVPLEALLEA